ncbi:MAG: HesA/MoeB/ThiF family protein [Candidatus Nezhaarchaeales archaeon]|nr:MAG: adenylyltransferase [Candidatus Nezhaarchaeota archaeon WYZ-LMO8]
MQLSLEELERYDRQIRIPDFGVDGQRKLKSSTALVAGLGGLGCPVSMYLAASGIGKLVIVDKERVELSNLNRQILHWPSDIGKLKVESVAEKIAMLNPNVSVEPLALEINEDNVENLVKRVDVVVDGMDNYKTRFLLNASCVSQGKPFVHAAVHGLEGQLLTVLPGKGPCLRCVIPSEPPQEALVPVLSVTPGVMAALEVMEVVKLIVGLGKPCSDRLLIFDGYEMKFHEIKVEPSPNCPVCSKFTRSKYVKT